MWTRLSNLNLETNLPPLGVRIAARASHIAAKTLLYREDSFSARRIKEGLARHPNLPDSNTYGSHFAINIKKTELDGELQGIETDTPTLPYNLPNYTSETDIV